MSRPEALHAAIPPGDVIALHDEPPPSAVYARLVREQLALLGEDPDREGLLKTPERVAIDR